MSKLSLLDYVKQKIQISGNCKAVDLLSDTWDPL